MTSGPSQILCSTQLVDDKVPGFSSQTNSPTYEEPDLIALAVIKS